jgi:hypothetical protein
MAKLGQVFVNQSIIWGNQDPVNKRQGLLGNKLPNGLL